MRYIIVTLPVNRILLGSGGVFDDQASDSSKPIFSFEVDGKSDNAAAAAAGNPLRDPTKPFGDTPCGEYVASIGYEPDDAAGVNRRSYGMPDDTGKIPVIWLQPIEGAPASQAWQRQLNENTAAGHFVDMGLALHSGPPNAQGALRPTHGCIRSRQSDQTHLLGLFVGVKSFKVSVIPEGATS